VNASEVRTYNFSDGSNTAPTTPTIFNAVTNANKSVTITCGGSTDLDDDVIRYVLWTSNDNVGYAVLGNNTAGTYTINYTYGTSNFSKCQAQDLYGGISANTTPTNITSGYGWCGDSIVNDVEQCDLLTLPFSNCADYNVFYRSGTLTCSGDCTYDVRACLTTIGGTSVTTCNNNLEGVRQVLTIIPLLIAVLFMGFIVLLYSSGHNLNDLDLSGITVPIVSIILAMVLLGVGSLILGSIC
jgi:hypothetical protein